MKEKLYYIAILSLAVFSFYYTKEVTTIIKDDDPLMISIMSNNINNTLCSEGIIIDDELIPGSVGKTLDIKKSYNNMKGIGYDESLLVFNTIPCMIDKDSYLEKYIIRGNDSKNAVSFLLNVNNLRSELKDLENYQHIKLSYIVGDKEIKKYKDDFINGKYEIIYKGNDKKYLKEYINICKTINITPYCISDYNDNIDLCSKNKVNTIKGSSHISKNVFNSGREKLIRGEFIIIEESKSNIEELNLLINYTKNKGYNVYSINEHLN